MFLKSSLKILIFLIGMLWFPVIGSAACSDGRSAELSRIAANVGFSYNYIIDGGIPHFTITMTNLTNDIYVEDDYGTVFSGTGEKNKGYQDGYVAKFRIYSNDPSCKGEEILTQYVSLPTFNGFSTHNECKEYPDFKYCGMWNNSSIAYEKFYNEFSIYKEKLKQVKKQVKEEKSFIEQIMDFVFNNIFVALIIIAISLIATIIIVLRIISKKRRGKIWRK